MGIREEGMSYCGTSECLAKALEDILKIRDESNQRFITQMERTQKERDARTIETIETLLNTNVGFIKDRLIEILAAQENIFKRMREVEANQLLILTETGVGKDTGFSGAVKDIIEADDAVKWIRNRRKIEIGMFISAGSMLIVALVSWLLFLYHSHPLDEHPIKTEHVERLK